jgi:hypothetical protein
MSKVCLFPLLVAATLVVESNFSIANSSEDSVVWKVIGPNGLEAADIQQWHVKNLPFGAKTRTFEFSALRFHLGYYEIKLVSMDDYVRSKNDQIAQEQKVDKNLPALFELGVRTVFQINPFNEPIVAVAPGGFTTSNQEPRNLGYLKINGLEKSKMLPKATALSAVLCLNNAPSPKYQYQVPTFYRTNNPNQTKLVNQCQDEVQVGPRIIEDDSVTTKKEFESDPDKYKGQIYNQRVNGKDTAVQIYLGVTEKAAFSTPYLRTIIAVDDPGRVANNPNSDNSEKELARNGYFIVTTTPATLWDLQDMLSNPDFYAKEQYAPHWAVNLPGDNYAAMIRVGSIGEAQQKRRDMPIEIGAVDQRQASVLVVTKRR